MVDSELLDCMTEVELHLKYQSLKSLGTLKRDHRESSRLPAKEALRELYQKRGDSAKVQETAREMLLLRERLTQKSIKQVPRPDAAEQVEKRRLTDMASSKRALDKRWRERGFLLCGSVQSHERLLTPCHEDRFRR